MIVAGNGTEAVGAYDQGGLDMILMDVEMPDMNGLDATRAIRLREATSGKHITILALTAHATAGDRERCLEAGMDDYVSKPLQVRGLRKTVAQWLNRANLPPEKSQTAFGYGRRSVQTLLDFIPCLGLGHNLIRGHWISAFSR